MLGCTKSTFSHRSSWKTSLMASRFVIVHPKIYIFMGGIKSFKLYNFQIRVRSASVVSECINHWDL